MATNAPSSSPAFQRMTHGIGIGVTAAALIVRQPRSGIIEIENDLFAGVDLVGAALRVGGRHSSSLGDVIVITATDDRHRLYEFVDLIKIDTD